MKPWNLKVQPGDPNSTLWTYTIAIPIVLTNVTCRHQEEDPNIESCTDEVTRLGVMDLLAMHLNEYNQSIALMARLGKMHHRIDMDIDTVIDAVVSCVKVLKKAKEDGLTTISDADDGRFAADLHAFMGDGRERKDNLS